MLPAGKSGNYTSAQADVVGVDVHVQEGGVETIISPG